MNRVGSMEENNIKNCVGCIYYYITWDKKYPRGCKGFGFKSVRMPCEIVKESSGEMCKMYMPKPKKE